MARDYTNISITCPLIDNVVDFIGSIDWTQDELDLESESEITLDQLETIRKHNSGLREFGNEQHVRADEFENELDDARKKIESLEDIISDMEETQEQLETRIDQLNDENNLLQALIDELKV